MDGSAGKPPPWLQMQCLPTTAALQQLAARTATESSFLRCDPDTSSREQRPTAARSPQKAANPSYVASGLRQ